MNKFIYVFMLIIHGAAYCQSSKNVGAEVEYSFFSDSFIPTSYFATLYIKGDVSLFHEKPNDNATRGEAKTEDGRVYESGSASGGTNFIEPYLKIDRKQQKIFFFEEIGANLFLIEDNYNDLKWNITEEAKTIEHISCIKATVNFRGREWIAWFAPEIPLPFGPWKLHGLPGLIMEVHDSTKKYTWKAVKIDYKTSDLFTRDFSSLMKAKNTKPISYQQFLQDTQEYHDNVHAEMVKDDPDLHDVPVPNVGRELKYEWEDR